MPKAAKTSQTLTVAQVKKMTVVHRLKIKGEDQQEVIVPGDCLFLVHAGIDLNNRPRTGRPYWKARVQSIHRQDENTSLLVVAWFYDPQDVRKELKRKKLISRRDLEFIDTHFGDTELLASDHLDVVNAQSVESKGTIHIFNDTKHLEAAIPVNSWFSRFTLSFDADHGSVEETTSHCICETSYSPVTSTQRYCQGCKTWFDIECMIRGPQKAWRGPLSKKIATAPVMRGDLGAGSDQWNVVGSGRKVRKMRQWVDSDTLPSNWKELLGDQFVQYMVTTNFTWYRCPRCDILI